MSGLRSGIVVLVAWLAGCDDPISPAPPATGGPQGILTGSTVSAAPSSQALPYADAALPDPADFADAAADRIGPDNYRHELDIIADELDRSPAPEAGGGPR